MHPRATNIRARARDDYRFGFELASALEFVNEHSGLAVVPAPILASQNSRAQCLKGVFNIDISLLLQVSEPPVMALVAADRQSDAKARVAKRRASKARGGSILFCIRLTSNAAGVDAAPPECIVYFDPGPKV